MSDHTGLKPHLILWLLIALFEHNLSYMISVLKSGCVGGAPTPHAFTMRLLPIAVN
jgi:hypothetical protein